MKIESFEKKKVTLKKDIDETRAKLGEADTLQRTITSNKKQLEWESDQLGSMKEEYERLKRQLSKVVSSDVKKLYDAKVEAHRRSLV